MMRAMRLRDLALLCLGCVVCNLALHLRLIDNQNLNEIHPTSLHDSNGRVHVQNNQGSARHHVRVFLIDDNSLRGSSSESSPHFDAKKNRYIEQYPAEFTDVTQLYDIKSSDDPAVSNSMKLKSFPKHETDDLCVPMSQWQTYSFPTCNNLHEMGMTSRVSDNSLKLFSIHGSWRDAWSLKTDAISPYRRGRKSIILKTIKLEHTMQESYFEFSRVDALAMERLTSSPHVMGIYGFCGVSVLTKRGRKRLASVVNSFSSKKKLDIAIGLGKSIRAVHEINGKGGPAELVHNDINIWNILLGAFDIPLLNDFNISVLMMKNKYSNKRCTFINHFQNPQWRSPEEQDGPSHKLMTDLNEKVDIYALGNILFQLISNQEPWQEMVKDGTKLTLDDMNEIAFLKQHEAKTPMIPNHVMDLEDPYIGILLKAMKWCYQFEPERRPTARELVLFLQKSRKKLVSNHGIK